MVARRLVLSAFFAGCARPRAAPASPPSRPPDAPAALPDGQVPIEVPDGRTCADRPEGCAPLGARSAAAALGGAREHWGKAVVGPGDIDGDGTADLVVSAPDADGGRGRVVLLRGPVAPADLDAAPALTGPVAGTQAGRALAAPGDVDGDGRADLVVAGPGPDREGVAWLLLGPVAPGALDEAAVARWTFGPGYGAGLTAAGPGDVTGDGVADLLIGHPRGSRAGTVRIVPGPLVDGATDGPRLLGEAPDDFAGTALDGAGDLDGDGVRDIVVGAWGHDGGGVCAGRVYAVHGPVTDDRALADADGVVQGLLEWDVFGFSVASAGDVDGDGHDEVLVGAYGHDAAGLSAGSAWLLPGPLPAHLTGADAVVVGAAADDSAGWAVDALGDVNGDGRADLLVGSPGWDAAGVDAGGAAVLLGPLDGVLPWRAASGTLRGTTPGARTGAVAVGAGDLDGDGSPDAVLAAPDAGPVLLFTALGG